jgi:hypothetical protein
MTINITQKLTGQALIDHANRYQQGNPKSDLCKEAGYLKTLRDGTVGADFIGFYENLLAAKQEANPELYETQSEYPEYDQLEEDTKALYDRISEDIGRTWKHEETLDFIDELEDIGIEDVAQFDDAFVSFNESSWNAEAEFAEELINELENLQDSLVYHAIDWQAVWDHQLRYDYNTIEFDGATYFFRNL